MYDRLLELIEPYHVALMRSNCAIWIYTSIALVSGKNKRAKTVRKAKAYT